MNSKILIFSFLFLVTANATPSNNEPCDINIDTQLQPDPENCNRYYQCGQSGWIGVYCPLGTYFNPEIHVCDHKENVDCKDNKTMNPSLPQIPYCDGGVLNDFKPDPNDCSKFFQCSEYGWVAKSCKEGLYFNPDISVCDYPSNVHCASKTLNVPTPCDGGEVNDLKPDPNDCSKFYQCTNYGWVSLSCKQGLYFNPDILVCDYPWNVQCANETLNDPTPCDGGELNDLKADPSDCSKFYQCTNYGWVSLSCKPGLYFNPLISVCDLPEHVDCKNETLNANQCDGANVDDLKPDPTDCTKFYECTNYGWVSLSCRQGLYFNPATLLCDWPSNVDCTTN